MDRVTITSNINTFTGYGNVTTEIIKGLVAAGYDVNVRAIAKSEPFGSKIPVEISSRFVSRVQQEEWETLIHPPDFCPTPKKKTAYFTMWESSRLPPTSMALLKRASLIITPSAWNASCFSASGLDIPIRIVPLGIDPAIFNYQPIRTDRVVFGAAGRMAHGGARKGINEVIYAFQKAFPIKKYPHVRLRVKAFEDCNVDSVSGDPRIDVIKKFLSSEELAKWLGTLTCFVSAAKGEGWGLLQHESMAMGRPVVTSIYGGLAEFMERSNSFHVRYRLNPGGTFYNGCGVWCEPDEDDLIATLRYVHDHPEEVVDKGMRASRSARRMTWANTVSELIRVYQEFGIVQKPKKRK